jgi:hypothetical protein
MDDSSSQLELCDFATRIELNSCFDFDSNAMQKHICNFATSTSELITVQTFVQSSNPYTRRNPIHSLKMVATRSKTRSSTGGDDHQPKIDDVLEDASTGRKRRASKGGKADGEEGGAKKGGAKNKKRKTEEGNGEEVKGDDAATSGAMDLGDGDGKESGEGKEEQPIVVDSSRVDVQADENKASNEENKEVEEIKESDFKETESREDELKENEIKEDGEAKEAEVSDNQESTENKAEEPSTGATDKQEVKEAEKEIVQNDNVTEYGTIHFLYKPKVRFSPSPFLGLTDQDMTGRSSPSWISR